MVSLSEQTVKTLENNIGISYNQMINLDDDQAVAYVQSKTGVPLRFSKKLDSRKIGRGNPLLARRRIKTIDDINTKIDSMR